MFDRAFIKASSVNRALEVIGDRWLIMILQQAWFGVRRFDEFQGRLEIARSTLASRLRHLIDHGVMTRRAYSARPLRHEYRLTDQGLALLPAALLMLAWQERWAPPRRAPVIALRHRDCGQLMEPVMVCRHCHQPVDAREVEYRPGPGASAPGTDATRRRRSTVEGQPAARTMVATELLELLGDRWTPQVAATAFFGLRRFEDMREALQLAPNILSDRLRRLVELGIFRTEPYQARPLRLHYRLTEKGRAVYPILLALMQWADHRDPLPAGPPLELVHRPCGQRLEGEVVCGECGGELHRRNVLPVMSGAREDVASGQHD